MNAPYEKPRADSNVSPLPSARVAAPPPVHAGGSSARDDDEVDLGELLATVFENRWLIAAVAAAVTLGGALYAFTATPIYRADAMVQVEEKNSSLAGMKDLTAMFGGDVPSEAEIEIIRSRSVLANVVEQLALDTQVTPKHLPPFGGAMARRHRGAEPAEPPLGLDSYAWGGERIRVTRLEIPPSLEAETLTLRAGEAESFTLFGPEGDPLVTGSAGVAASSADGEVKIFVSELRARSGTEFLIDKLSRVEAIAEFQKELGVREKGKQTGVIHLSLEGPDRERITATLDAIANAYLRQNVERKSEEAEKTLAFITEQLPALRAELEEAEVRLNEYRSKLGSVDLRLETEAMLTTAVEVEKQLTELSLRGAELKRRFTEQHPLVVAYHRQKAQLEAEKAAIESQMKNLPEAELNNVRLMRDVQVANELYLLLLNKAQELKVVKSGTIGNVRILDRAALVQQKPVHPRKLIILALSVMGGLAIGTALAFARKSLQRGLDDPDELEKRIGLPVYASLPHSERQAAAAREFKRRKGGLTPLSVVDPGDLAVEALRSLRTSLQFALADAKNNVVLIGGPRPAVGKSFVSVNLALLIADSGKRVLLVDADMRKGHLHAYFGMQRVPGLSEILSGATDLSSATRVTSNAGVSFVSTGTLPPNPSELLLGSRFENFVSEASAQFDLVIIDAPPLLAVTDAVIIGRLAGVNLLVLRAGLHPAREVALAVNRMNQNGVRPNGFIFNDVTIRRGPYGYGKYGYHYQYEYK